MPFNETQDTPEEDFIVGFEEEEDTGNQLGQEGSNLPDLLDARMNELPEQQKKFFLDHLTPETLGMLTLVIGEEALNYFQPLTAMDKTIVVQDKENLDADLEPLPKPGSTAPAEASEESSTPDPDQFTF